MNAVTESTGTPSPPASPGRAGRLVNLAFMLLPFGVAAYAIVRHDNRFWNAAIAMLSAQGVVWLTEHWVRKQEPPVTGLERFATSLKAGLVVLPIVLVLGIGFLVLFPNWFPDACPIPPR